MTILAVDPGLNNGIAVLGYDRQLLTAGEIPIIGEGPSKRLHLAFLVSIIDLCSVKEAVVEDVSAMPQQGVSSTFRFGRATGAIEGALSALGIPTAFVKPAAWKKAIGAKAKADENIRALAIQQWPSMAHLFARVKDHNRAEAALIGLHYLSKR